MSKNNQGNQTELVKQAVVRYIRDQRLPAGGRLPTQATLRCQLGVGNVTISRALEALQQDGVLEIRERKGVFVRDPDADGYIGRHIGLACMRVNKYPFGASLLQCLEVQMHDHSCQVVPFLRSHDTMYNRDSLELFNGLRRNLQQKRIDGLITSVSLDDLAWNFCDEQEIPVCFVGTYNRQRYGVFIDDGHIIRESLRRSAAQGFRRPALVSIGYPRHEEHERIFREEAAPLLGELDPASYCRIFTRQVTPLDDDSLRASLQGMVADFIAMPPERRPDVMLIPDDLLAGWTYVEMLRLRERSGGWLPSLVHLRNRQIPMLLDPEMGDYWETDAMEIARMAIEALLGALRERELFTQQIWYRPKLIVSTNNSVDNSNRNPRGKP